MVVHADGGDTTNNYNDSTHRGGEGGGAAGPVVLVTTVEVSGNDVGAEANPAEGPYHHHAASGSVHPTDNPSSQQRQRPAVVYRVTSLPLDAYSEVVQQQLRAQQWREEEGGSSTSRRRAAAVKRAKKGGGAGTTVREEGASVVAWLMGCCWTGWLCLV